MKKYGEEVVETGNYSARVVSGLILTNTIL
jgi:hypothetical protein